MKELQNVTTEQQNAFDMIAKTNISFYLAGRAGTGKSTFLRRVQEEVDKQFVVLAPTGVAAVNVGGQTVHSFFGFPFGVLCPGDIGTMNEEKITLVRHIDTIVVDEVSMTRCDVIDAMDRTLRHYRKSSAPFGGVQMVFVGDLFQLEPVTTEQDAAILREFYGCGPYYFYRAAAVERLRLPKIEFTTIFRQTDPVFIGILEDIRTGKVTARDLMRINSRVCCPGEGSTELKVMLTTTRRAAQSVNERRLAELEAPEMVYEATYEGEPRKDDDVAVGQLVLKAGAQVMFTRNDSQHRWYNGSLGTAEELTEASVKVRLDSGDVYEVQREQWEDVEYEYDKEARTCRKKVKGTTSQYPLRLAWAITVHKSQSLTFDRVAVDFGQRAFCNGQAYVALSRVRSLEGLELVRPMTLSSVLVSRDILRFCSDVNDERLIRRELAIGSAVDTFLRTRDYDAAAVKFYAMAQEVAEQDQQEAYDLVTRALSVCADDACLCGLGDMPRTDTTVQGRILEAVGKYYSGDGQAAERILLELGPVIARDVNALYVLSRCQEDRLDWAGVEQTYGAMLGLLEELRDRGLDDEAFRKVRYRVAILNESVYGDPGAGLMRQLIAENPSYARYHEAIRRMLVAGGEARPAEDDESPTPLVDMLFDPGVPDRDFADAVVRAWAAKDVEWKAYRRFLNNLRLPMPF